jgi:hypothetical protein
MGTECILVVAVDETEKKSLHRAWFRSDLLLPSRFVEDTSEAVDYLKLALSSKLDLLPLPGIMVLSLNGDDGGWQEALRWVRRQPSLRSLFILVRSEDGNPETAKACYSLGADFWVPRSEDLNEMFRLLRGVQNCWLHSYGTSGRILMR